jgi:ComF family protein
VLGSLIEQHLRERPLQADVVVPVPMAPGRLRERGYNQAELLAAQVAGHIQAKLAPNLLARGDRPAQQKLTAEQRASNLKGALSARGRLDGLTVLLVDDVATTGATLSACADALVAAGAREVRALVFARDL